MFKYRVRVVSMLLILIVFAGCSSLPSVPLDQSNASRIKTIGILEIKPPIYMNVENLGGAGAAFGLVGGLSQAVGSGSHSETFRNALSERQVPITTHLRNSIENELRSNQYEVAYLQGQQVSRERDAKGDYSEVKTDVNAILNVWITQFGYVSPPSFSSYIPFVVIRARLLDTTTRQEIYFKTYTCGYDIMGKGDSDFVSSNYHFPSFDALMTTFDETSKGLLTCETDIAKLIGRDLKRR
jgi:hypothetical protein